MKAYKLKYPIKYGSETIKEVPLNPIKAKHLRGLNLADMNTDAMLELLEIFRAREYKDRRYRRERFNPAFRKIGKPVLEFPTNYESIIGHLAYNFHFQPSELWEFESHDFDFWFNQLEEINKCLKKENQ